MVVIDCCSLRRDSCLFSVAAEVVRQAPAVPARIAVEMVAVVGRTWLKEAMPIVASVGSGGCQCCVWQRGSSTVVRCLCFEKAEYLWPVSLIA